MLCLGWFSEGCNYWGKSSDQSRTALALSEVKVTQSCPTFCDPMDCSLPGSSVHEILQARILEWVAVPFSRGSSKPRDWTQVSCTAGGFFTVWTTRKAHPWPQSSCKICSQKPPCTGAWELAFPAQPWSCHGQWGVRRVPGSSSAVLSPRGTVRSCYLGNSGTANGFLVSPKEDQIEKLNEMMKRKVQKEKKKKSSLYAWGQSAFSTLCEPFPSCEGVNQEPSGYISWLYAGPSNGNSIHLNFRQGLS